MQTQKNNKTKQYTSEHFNGRKKDKRLSCGAVFVASRGAEWSTQITPECQAKKSPTPALRQFPEVERTTIAASAILDEKKFQWE